MFLLTRRSSSAPDAPTGPTAPTAPTGPRRIAAVVAGFALALTTAISATPAHAATFTDVPPGLEHRQHIQWLADEGISTGWPDGTYRPLQPVNRDAMAAFLYRLAGSPAYVAPAQSAFADVTPGTQFYKEMSWLAATGISQGWDVGGGKKEFRPVTSVNRDAMAAFMYRFAGSPEFQVGARPFKDVVPGMEHGKEMAWLAAVDVAKGWPDMTYRPLEPVRRDAMAAFMHRLSANVGVEGVPPVTQETMITADEMLTAPLPSVCGHQPGTLVDGRLPKSSLKDGMGVAQIYGIAERLKDWRSTSFVSWMGSDDKAYAALVVECNQGGVGWPPEVVLYGSGPTALGALSVGSIHEGRQVLVDLAAVDGAARLSLSNNYQSEEGGCCGTMDAVVDVRWDGSTVTGTSVATFNEVATVEKAVAAVNSGDRNEMAKYFPDLDQVDSFGLTWETTPIRCVARFDLATVPQGTNRVCLLAPTSSVQVGGWIAMTRTGFGEWQARAFGAVTTD